jgi:hypothetical protein
MDTGWTTTTRADRAAFCASHFGRQFSRQKIVRVKIHDKLPNKVITYARQTYPPDVSIVNVNSDDARRRYGHAKG